MRKRSGEVDGAVVLAMLVAAAVVVIVLAMLFGWPHYRVWQQGLEGEAMLKKAEQEKQILVQQAEAERSAASMRAEAIETIGAMAQKYPEYRQQEFIGAFADALRDGKIQQIVYVPTEANIPILEANPSRVK